MFLYNQMRKNLSIVSKTKLEQILFQRGSNTIDVEQVFAASESDFCNPSRQKPSQSQQNNSRAKAKWPLL